MAVNYDKADKDALRLLDSAMEQFHEPLLTAGVTVQVLFAFQYDGDGELIPAVKVHGLNAAAKTSVTSLPDRVRGIPDAKIIVDRCAWESMAESRRLALMDRELEHLTLAFDSDGILKRDDHNRPKLKLRKHDAEITYFHRVAQRHGEASVEAALIRHFNAEYGEQLLLFGKSNLDVAPQEDRPNGSQTPDRK